MMKRIIVILMLLMPVLASAQLPLISGDTKIKFQKGDLTWLARVDTLAKYFASGPTGIYGGSGFVPNDTYARLSGSNAAQRYFQLGYFPASPSTLFNRREAGLYFDDSVLGLINSDSIGNTQAYLYIQPNQMYVTANNASSSKTGYVQVEPTQVSLVADSVRIGSLTTNNAALSVVGLNDATGVTYATSVAGWDRNASDDITGSGAANQVAVWSGSNSVSGSDALSYETNTLRITPSARDTHFSIIENSTRMFGIQAIQDTFNGSVNAWKVGALRNKAGRVYLTGEELFVDGPLRQVTGGGIEFKGTTGSTFFNTDGNFYSGTLTGSNNTYTRNLHWYFLSGGIDGQLGNPMIFQHAYEGNDTTGNSFEFLARNTASGGITHPDSTLFRIGNWDRGSALSIRHNRNVGLRTNSPLYSLHINATDAMRVPTGTTAERPASLQQGLLRFNTSETVLEYYDGSDWQSTASGTSLFLQATPSNVSASGTILTLTANENQAFGDAVYINTDGEAQLADADGIATARVVAIATGTILANATGSYLLFGVSRNDSWAWTVGAPVYLSTTGTSTNTMTQTAPTGTDDCVVQLGIATAATRILINPSTVIIELE